MDEIFDLVDADDRVIGQAPRAEVHRRGLRHRAVHIFVEDAAGRFFLQLRAPTKDLHPNTWDSSASGHLGAGEGYDATAARELEEELGLAPAELRQPLVPLFGVAAHALTGNEFVRVYHLRHDGPLRPDAGEIAGGHWGTAAEIDAWLRREPVAFAPSFAALWRAWRGTPEVGDPLPLTDPAWLRAGPVAVRSACARVAASARHVRLVDQALDPLVTAWRGVDGAALTPPLDRERHYAEPLDPDDTLAYWLTLAAVNFGSGWFPILHKRPGHSGYFHVAACLADRWRRGGPPAPEALAELTAAEVQAWIEQPAEADLAGLAEHWANALRALGQRLLGAHGGSWTALRAAGGDSVRPWIGELVQQPYFRDAAWLDGLPVPFLKRAQLAAADLSLALDQAGPRSFRDLDDLTLFADNLVPHVLRHLGVLEVDEALATRLDGGDLLRPGERAEVELRAVAVTAVEQLSRRTGHPPRVLDALLWHRGQEPRFKALPRPRCRTVFY